MTQINTTIRSYIVLNKILIKRKTQRQQRLPLHTNEPPQQHITTRPRQLQKFQNMA
uniref:Uncharacterized protein n=1 Tax=Zea mays TaxID=4577 RepID=C4J1V2_MAIZE|nr:unknown [Zea mays]